MTISLVVSLMEAMFKWACLFVMGWYFLCAHYKLIALLKDFSSKIMAIENQAAYQAYLMQQAHDQALAQSGNGHVARFNGDVLSELEEEDLG